MYTTGEYNTKYINLVVVLSTRVNTPINRKGGKVIITKVPDECVVKTVAESTGIVSNIEWGWGGI